MFDNTETKPSVLFLCVKNGGKSQMAAALMRSSAGEQTDVYSAGTEPGNKLNEEAAQAVAEVGATFEGEYPKPIDPELLDTVDRVVVIGTDAEVEPGKSRLDVWEVDEPSLRGIEGMERLRLMTAEMQERVEQLMRELLG